MNSVNSYTRRTGKDLCFSATPPKKVKCLGLEIRSSYKGLPVTVNALDADGICGVTPNPKAPWNGFLLPGYDKDLLSKKFVSKHDFDYEVAAIFLAEFTGDCWREAIGTEYPIHVFANHQDRLVRYDCVKHEWYKPEW